MNGLSLVIPAYNSESMIKNSLYSYHSKLSPKFKNLEIIVVCNGCSDNTAQICKSINEIPIKVIELQQRGKGYALIRGFNESKFDIVGFLDADNPYDLEEVTKMLDFLDNHDMVIVTKFNKSLKYQASFSRRLFSIFGAIVSRFLFGIKFKDTQAGAKFMKRKIWASLKRPFICNGFEFDMELLYKAAKINTRIKEYYISPKETDFSTVKLRILPGMIYRLLKLRIME